MKRNKKRITVKDLNINHQKYDEVVKQLLQTVGTPEHIKIVRKERKLYKRDLKIRKSLGFPYWLDIQMATEEEPKRLSFHAIDNPEMRRKLCSDGIPPYLVRIMSVIDSKKNT